MARFILDDGLDLKQHPEDGRRALIEAVERGYGTIVRMLHEAGNEFDGPDEGRCPMRLAMMQGQEHIVKLLIELGAKRIDLGKPGALQMEEIVNDNKKSRGVVTH